MDSYISYYSTSLGISIKGLNSNKLRKYSTNIRRKNKDTQMEKMYYYLSIFKTVMKLIK